MQEKIAVVIDQDLEDLIPGFLENRAGEIDKIRQAVDTGDFEAIDRIAHDMKGLGAGYGFQGITDIGIKMREVSLLQDSQQVQSLLDEYQYYLGNLDISYE